ncbi:hypothetical protein PFISCL1PPCAC_28945, partial [Pristionchus fissidentatus]
STKSKQELVYVSAAASTCFAIFQIETEVAGRAEIELLMVLHFLFFGIASVAPFWCLMRYAPSIRRFCFSMKKETPNSYFTGQTQKPPTESTVRKRYN